MKKKEAYSWLEQPGIKALMPCDKDTQMALKIALNVLHQTIVKEQDEYIEKVWEEFEDVLFIEDEESDDSCKLVLASDWHNFCAGTTRDEIWRWFDQKHSKGLHWLMYGDTVINEVSL